jgi:hypothetical protein
MEASMGRGGAAASASACRPSSQDEPQQQGPLSYAVASLAPARPAGSSLLLWRPWALLLRLLLQLGVSQEALLWCCSLGGQEGVGGASHWQGQGGAAGQLAADSGAAQEASAEAEEVRQELLELVPSAAHEVRGNENPFAEVPGAGQSALQCPTNCVLLVAHAHMHAHTHMLRHTHTR